MPARIERRIPRSIIGRATRNNDRTAASWGFQQAAEWEAGETNTRPLVALEQAIAVSPYPINFEQRDQQRAHPLGLWRVSAQVTTGSIAAIAEIAYGSGNQTLLLDNIICPLIAYVPGYARVQVRPRVAVPEAETLVVRASAVPVMGYGVQQVAQLIDAQASAVVVPQSAYGFTAWAASTYTPTGAPAPIAIAAGVTVDWAGQVTLNTGIGVAWHEL